MNTLEQDLKDEGQTDAEVTPKKNARTQWNWIQVSGRLASDIEKKQVKEQTVVQFTLVYETMRKTDKDGSHANFIEVELWGKLADLYSTLLVKGMEIIATGELFQQRWVNKDGKKAQKFAINAQAIAISDQSYRPN